MFVVEVGALLTTIQLVRDHLHHVGSFGWGLQITVWLWFTVVFANFAEAWRKDAARRRPTRCAKPEQRLKLVVYAVMDRSRLLQAPSCARETRCRCGRRVHPRRREVIEGVASVDESAITGDLLL